MKVKYTKCDICGRNVNRIINHSFCPDLYVLRLTRIRGVMKYKLDICQECMDKIVQYIQSKTECQEDA